MNPTSAITSAVPIATPEPPKPKNASEAAQQFEALLLTQMLRAARSEDDSKDSTLDTMWDLAAQQFAQVLADSGGLGLAEMIRENLKDEQRGLNPEVDPLDVSVQEEDQLPMGGHLAEKP